MTASKRSARALLALVGTLLLVLSTAVVVNSIRPTEASWADQVRGVSNFGMHADAGRNYARAISGHGVIERQINSYKTTEARAVANPSNPSASSPLAHSDSGVLAALPLEMTGTSCATIAPRQGADCGASSNLSPATSFASSKVDRLRIWTAGIRDRQVVGYGSSESQQPITATATCVPGQDGQAHVSAGGPIVLRDKAELYLPQPNHQTTATHRTLLTSVTGTLQYHQSQGAGWARAEARLYVTSTEIAADFKFHVVLASAECGIARATPDEAPRPTSTRPSALPESPNRPSSTTFAGRAVRQPVAEVAEEHAADLPQATENAAEVPALSGSKDDAARDEAAGSGTGTAEPVTSFPATQGAGTSAPTDSNVGPTTTAPEPAPTETAAPAPTEQAPATEGPQQPESVRVGSKFAVVNRDGVELGSAKIEDIVRTSECGVELTLSITTSDEAGAGRWATVEPSDFAEVRPGGTTRDAQRVNSDCEQASNPTALQPGRDYEITISFMIDDSAQRAMLRPAGTAGWIFDLPALPKVAATTTPKAVSAPSTTSPSIPNPSAAASDTIGDEVAAGVSEA